MSDKANLQWSFMTNTNEWYTPRPYIQAVYDVLGCIHLDPASNYIANDTVNAHTYFDINDDGYNQKWWGNVFLNPPYGKDPLSNVSNQAKWSSKMISEYESGNVDSAILLVNASTDTTWFTPLWKYPICFTNHRVRFLDPDGNKGKQPVKGSAFVYFGFDKQKFAHVFKQFGAVVLDTIT